MPFKEHVARVGKRRDHDVLRDPNRIEVVHQRPVRKLEALFVNLQPRRARQQQARVLYRPLRIPLGH